MGEFFGFLGRFFHGWKRKAGCVTLVLACMSLIAWVRSIVSGDDIIEMRSDNTTTYAAGLPSTGFWIVKKRLTIFLFKDGGSASSLDYELICVVPYWYVILPMMLLSAYLLLGKTVVGKPKSISET